MAAHLTNIFTEVVLVQKMFEWSDKVTRWGLFSLCCSQELLDSCVQCSLPSELAVYFLRTCRPSPPVFTESTAVSLKIWDGIRTSYLSLSLWWPHCMVIKHTHAHTCRHAVPSLPAPGVAVSLWLIPRLVPDETKMFLLQNINGTCKLSFLCILELILC